MIDKWGRGVAINGAGSSEGVGWHVAELCGVKTKGEVATYNGATSPSSVWVMVVPVNLPSNRAFLAGDGILPRAHRTQHSR